MSMSIPTLVNRIIEYAHKIPDKVAVAFKKDRLTYLELACRSAALSEEMRKIGIRVGDRVCYSALSKPESIVYYLAIHMAGAVAVFLDKNATVENMLDVYHRCGAKILFTDKPIKDRSEDIQCISLRGMYELSTGTSLFKDRIDDYRIEPDENDLSELLFTTGTTGIPKGVKLSYKSVFNILNNTIEGIGISDEDILLMPLPLNHSFALRVVRAVLYNGATLILQNGFTFAKDVEKNVEQFGCNAMACVPASYEVMRSQMQDAFPTVLGNMRFIEFSAGSLSVQQRKTITKLLPEVTVYNTWGSSESGGAIFCNVTEAVKDENLIGSLGKPLEGKVEIRILDENGQEIDSSREHPGRMALKGDMQMTGYWDNDEETSKTLVDGWLLTGDMAYLEDGYVFMLGRADNIINVGGEKVSPIEVENVAGQCPGVVECACIGVEDPDGITGQTPVLFAVTDSLYDEEKLKLFLAGKLERYKIPQYFRYIDSLPRNRMQKVDYKALKDLWNEKGSGDLMNPVVRTILSRRSIRRFTDEPVSREALDLLVRCGYHAPSGHNMQSWKFTVLTREDDISLLRDKTGETAKANKVHFFGFENPKAIILISNDERNPDGCQDASCAAENIMIAATSLGLGSVWLNPLMTLRKISPVKEVLDCFNIPENHVVWAMIALGYPVSNGSKLQKKENVVEFV